MRFIGLLLLVACGSKDNPQQTLQTIAPAAVEDRVVTSYLGEFNVNLNDPSSLQILQMTIAVETSPDVAREVERRQAQLQDAVLLYTSDYTPDMVTGMQGKQNLKEELVLRVNGILDQNIDNMYFTKFTLSR